ncbi:hypothetical protein [Cupriavidus consociatus]|nr:MULTISPECIES: hypothetical protein [unclassified Cupriavidus]MBP0619603.1 hypothetical protein [Cupriavidus sp. LEh25]MDK2656253.1 hypothetical protein [Cupriavidus sp. LEh21]
MSTTSNLLSMAWRIASMSRSASGRSASRSISARAVLQPLAHARDSTAP